MQLIIKYSIDPWEFWRIEQFDWDKARWSDFDIVHFYGDFYFRYGEADFGYRNIPILGFAYYFTEGFLKCIHGREVRVEYTVEADDYILMRPVSEGYIWLEASHMSCGCQVAEKDLREALARANQQLIEEILSRFPFFSKHDMFNDIVRLLVSV